MAGVVAFLRDGYRPQTQKLGRPIMKLNFLLVRRRPRAGLMCKGPVPVTFPLQSESGGSVRTVSTPRRSPGAVGPFLMLCKRGRVRAELCSRDPPCVTLKRPKNTDKRRCKADSSHGHRSCFDMAAGTNFDPNSGRKGDPSVSAAFLRFLL